MGWDEMGRSESQGRKSSREDRADQLVGKESTALEKKRPGQATSASYL